MKKAHDEHLQKSGNLGMACLSDHLRYTEKVELPMPTNVWH
jgi:hypothetical protein